MPFLEEGAIRVLQNVFIKTFWMSIDKTTVAQSHIIVVVIGTPVDEHLNPQFTLFKKFLKTYCLIWMIVSISFA